MSSFDKMEQDGTLDHLSKRERLQVDRQRSKLTKNLGSIADLTRLPAALFVIDVQKEKIAVAEAHRLQIPVFAMVDTNSDPNIVDYAIPCNDDAAKAISLVLGAVCDAIQEGLAERKAEKDKEPAEGEEKPAKGGKKSAAKKVASTEDEAEAEANENETEESAE